MNTGNWINLIYLAIIVLSAGGGFLRWAYSKAQEQRAERERLAQQRRRREEAFRTGQFDQLEEPTMSVSTPTPPRQRQSTDAQADEIKRRLRELAEKRRREVEAARQGRTTPTVAPSPAQRSGSPGQRGPQPGQRGVGPPTRQPTTAGGSTAYEMERRRRQQQAEAAKRREWVERQRLERERARQQQRAQQAALEAQRKQLERRRAREAAKRAEQQRAQAQEGVPGVRSPAVGGARGAGLASFGLEPITPDNHSARENWQRAVMLLEVLSPPKSLRQPGEDVL